MTFHIPKPFNNHSATGTQREIRGIEISISKQA